MGIMNSELNYDSVIKDLGKCCLGEGACGGCNKDECIVGFAQKCITNCFKESVTYVENGSERIPLADFKIYNTEDFEAGIGHILKQCRSCKDDHFDNCIINIIRNCYEIGLFGEIQKYEGSSFVYLNELRGKQPKYADAIMEEFQNAEL